MLVRHYKGDTLRKALKDKNEKVNLKNLPYMLFSLALALSTLEEERLVYTVFMIQ